MKWIPNHCSCGSTNNAQRLFDAKDYNFNRTSQKGTIFICLDCGSLFPDRFPSIDSLNEMYVNYYTSFPIIRNKIKSLLRTLVNMTRRQYILRSTPKTACTLLDYGCGSGDFLFSLKAEKYQIDLYGTDLFKRIAHELDFKWLSIELNEVDNKYFDWITISHVIEHVSSIEVTLLGLKRVLKNNGYIWLSTPNPNSFLNASFKEHSRDIDFPRHRQIYSKNLLKTIFNRNGFRVQFSSPPRVNAIINFYFCVKNLCSDKDITLIKKVCIIISGVYHLIQHLVIPKRLRDLESPEIILVANR